MNCSLKLHAGIRYKVMWTPDEDKALAEAVSVYGDGKWTSMFLDPRFENRLLRHTTSEMRNRWKALIGEKYVPQKYRDPADNTKASKYTTVSVPNVPPYVLQAKQN